MINFTFIIPHWNHPSQLKRCVDSIPQRDDIEVIIVDDNSDPNIVDFNKFPCLDYPYVRVIFNKDNKGAGHARNLGLEIAQGKWLIFADCDDIFSSQLNKILDAHLKRSEDLVYYDVDCLDESTLSEVKNENFAYYRPLLLAALKNGDYEPLRYGIVPPWGKIIRRSVVSDNSIKFDETPVGNDLMFSLKVGYYSKTVGVSEDHLYSWIITANSLSTLKSLDKCDTHLDVNIRKNAFLRERGLSKYRTNLFKMIKRYRGHSYFSIIKRFWRIVLATESKYILIDFWRAFIAFLNK